MQFNGWIQKEVSCLRGRKLIELLPFTLTNNCLLVYHKH